MRACALCKAPHLICGPNGATIIVITYDDDAAQTYEGSLLEDLRVVLPKMKAPNRDADAALENRA